MAGTQVLSNKSPCAVWIVAVVPLLWGVWDTALVTFCNAKLKGLCNTDGSVDVDINAPLANSSCRTLLEDTSIFCRDLCDFASVFSLSSQACHPSGHHRSVARPLLRRHYLVLAFDHVLVHPRSLWRPKRTRTNGLVVLLPLWPGRPWWEELVLSCSIGACVGKEGVACAYIKLEGWRIGVGEVRSP